jgi:hypothetical protein
MATESMARSTDPLARRDAARQRYGFTAATAPVCVVTDRPGLSPDALWHLPEYPDTGQLGVGVSHYGELGHLFDIAEPSARCPYRDGVRVWWSDGEERAWRARIYAAVKYLLVAIEWADGRDAYPVEFYDVPFGEHGYRTTVLP